MMDNPITIPNVQLSLTQLIDIVRNLEPEARQQVAQALLKSELDQKIELLLSRLVNKGDSSDISDDDINAEIRVVRNRNRLL